MELQPQDVTVITLKTKENDQGYFEVDLNTLQNYEDDASELLFKDYPFQIIFRTAEKGFVVYTDKRVTLPLDNIFTRLSIPVDKQEIKMGVFASHQDFPSYIYQLKYVDSDLESFLINDLNDKEFEFNENSGAVSLVHLKYDGIVSKDNNSHSFSTSNSVSNAYRVLDSGHGTEFVLEEGECYILLMNRYEILKVLYNTTQEIWHINSPVFL